MKNRIIFLTRFQIFREFPIFPPHVHVINKQWPFSFTDAVRIGHGVGLRVTVNFIIRQNWTARSQLHKLYSEALVSGIKRGGHGEVIQLCTEIS
jgi:hypothetical protein